MFLRKSTGDKSELSKDKNNRAILMVSTGPSDNRSEKITSPTSPTLPIPIKNNRSRSNSSHSSHSSPSEHGSFGIGSLSPIKELMIINKNGTPYLSPAMLAGTIAGNDAAAKILEYEIAK